MKKDDKDTAIYVAHEDNEPFDPARPEKSLLCAVLLAAINDLKRQGEPRRKAEEYLLSSEDSYVFSFRGICSYLGVDPEQILISIGLKKRSQAPRQPARE